MKVILIAVFSMLLTGCASLSKGVAEAFLENKKEDTKVCEIIGKRFSGVESTFQAESGVSKVLKIHGVGRHVPGYSTEFLEKLAVELDMPVRNSQFKEIKLTNSRFPDKNLGVLRVKRFLNETETKELLFYELTWSNITEEQKAELNYDTSGEYSYRRAEVNNMLKKFSNDTSPDPMIFLGHRHDEIIASFTTAFCWMISANWDELPDQSNQYCKFTSDKALENLSIDNYSFVSHSLGSRIVIDGMQKIAKVIAKKTEGEIASTRGNIFIDKFKNLNITVYMLSNQLPLLQMGQKPAEVTGRTEEFCTVNGSHYNERIIEGMEVIAFSDPNDILSYAIADGFVENNLDSRLCIDITNVTINVVDIIDLFGLGKMANPMKAHTAYDGDDRVVALIAKGIGTSNTAPIVNEKCSWVRLID